VTHDVALLRRPVLHKEWGILSGIKRAKGLKFGRKSGFLEGNNPPFLLTLVEVG
jgi:hypothetical protein